MQPLSQNSTLMHDSYLEEHPFRPLISRAYFLKKLFLEIPVNYFIIPSKKLFGRVCKLILNCFHKLCLIVKVTHCFKRSSSITPLHPANSNDHELHSNSSGLNDIEWYKIDSLNFFDIPFEVDNWDNEKVPAVDPTEIFNIPLDYSQVIQAILTYEYPVPPPGNYFDKVFPLLKIGQKEIAYNYYLLDKENAYLYKSYQSNTLFDHSNLLEGFKEGIFVYDAIATLYVRRYLQYFPHMNHPHFLPSLRLIALLITIKQSIDNEIWLSEFLPFLPSQFDKKRLILMELEFLKGLRFDLSLQTSFNELAFGS